MQPTHHVVDIFEDVSEAADDEGELVLGDVDQTFLVVLCTDFGVGVLVANFNGKLKDKRSTMQSTHCEAHRTTVQSIHHYTVLYV